MRRLAIQLLIWDCVMQRISYERFWAGCLFHPGCVSVFLKGWSQFPEFSGSERKAAPPAASPSLCRQVGFRAENCGWIHGTVEAHHRLLSQKQGRGAASLFALPRWRPDRCVLRLETRPCGERITTLRGSRGGLGGMKQQMSSGEIGKWRKTDW